ncbi:MAG: MBL fold metallo-hydrolase [Chloroflexi bacterium]|nr:MBL fold metallo-hydrolase [Ardenticatenaceae bacterium]MBL1131505.1 MBL fold metallo-hydrolase [Chloroflexota bacterium]NOG37616.1 MBL fold metallo-hydrolase [Chloroflexota bacterium]GIK55594.1 MAG: MBL fold hydrolase [Chloroflexota bacterium]
MNPIRIELPTPFDVGPVNVYLFTEPEPALVDTGVDSDDSWAALQAGLAAHGLAVADLQRVVITHAHVDHLGAAARLTAHGDAQIYIADLGYEWLVAPKRKWAQRIAFYRDYFLAPCGLSPQAQQMVLAYMTYAAESSRPVDPERITTFTVGEQLAMGGLDWEVLHMPGHASHQTCFYQPATRQFISADMLLHKAPTPIVEEPPDGETRRPSLPLLLDSFTVLEELDIAIAYPGHGPLIHNADELIRQQRQRLQSRKQEALDHIRQGCQTVIELVNTMYAHYPENARIAGLWMVVGYLDLLKAEGVVEEQEIGGVWRYVVKGD